MSDLDRYLYERLVDINKRVKILCVELEHLREITKNDGIEIGSYRDGTGLRGENRQLEKRVINLEIALEKIAVWPPPDDAYELRMLARKALEGTE